MARKPKTNRIPRTRAGGEWTEAAFWGWLRSGLRKMSRRWPPIARQVMNKGRRPYIGPNKKQKFVYQCELCLGWFKHDDVQIDHIVPCGQLKSWEDFSVFAQRLFDEGPGLRRLCTKCHDARKAEAAQAA